MSTKLEIGGEVVASSFIAASSVVVFAIRNLQISHKKTASASEYILEVSLVASVLLATGYNVVQARKRVEAGRHIGRGRWYSGLVAVFCVPEFFCCLFLILSLLPGIHIPLVLELIPPVILSMVLSGNVVDYVLTSPHQAPPGGGAVAPPGGGAEVPPGN